jgi:membrane protease YdiL (CAAX protease family)
MDATRLHPVTRLLCCAAGLLVVIGVLALMPYLGGVLATIWLGMPPREPIAVIVQRYAFPLQVLSYPALLLWISYCRTHFDRHSFVSLGLRAQSAISNALRGILAGFLTVTLLWSVLWLSGMLSLTGWSSETLEKGTGLTALALGGYAFAFVLAAFLQELLFRGYALHNFSHWLGWKQGLWAQAVLFALFQLSGALDGSTEKNLAVWVALPSLSLLGVFLALCYRKTGTLWFPIGFQFAWSFLLGTVFSLPVSSNEFHLLGVEMNGPWWLTGTRFGVESSPLLIPVLLVFIFFLNQAPDHPQALLDLELSTQEKDFVPTMLPADPAPESESETESPEENRENRFRTKFGSSQGFSADTLRELRDLQEAREKVQREAEEATQREQVVVASFNPVAPPSPSINVSAAPAAAVASVPSIETKDPTQPLQIAKTAPPAIPVAPSTPPPTPTRPATTPPTTPAPVSAPTPASPTTDAPVKKKPAPRW